MKLPEIDAYAFPSTIPSTGKEIKMRPYLVREEKLLLMAQESDDYKEQTSALVQIIGNCTDGANDAAKAPYFDVEYLMLNLRARSIGDVATPIYVCNNQLASGQECGNETTVRLPLADIKASDTAPSNALRTVVINDALTLTLKYPNIYDINELIESLSGENFNSRNTIDALTILFDTLLDNTSNTVYDFAENTKEEKVEFLERMPPAILEKITEFFQNLPKVEHTLQYTCSSCNFTHTILISGLRSFLEFWENTTR